MENVINEPVSPRLIAVSRVFTRAWTQMTLPEIKAFAACLSAVSWKSPFPERIILQKNALTTTLGIHPDSSHQAERLRANLSEMPSHSFTEFSGWDREIYPAGHLITAIEEGYGTITFHFNPEYASLFGSLEKDYVTMLNTDIYSMTSRKSFYLYKELRTNCDSRLLNKKCFSDRELKLILRVPFSGPGSYVYTSSRGTAVRVTGSAQQLLNSAPQSDAVPVSPLSTTTPQSGAVSVSPSVTTVFDRSSFEKSVLLPALEDLSICRMISLSRDDSGSLFRKEKEDNRVTGYTLSWSVDLYPNNSPSHVHVPARELPSRGTGSLLPAEGRPKGPVSPSHTPVVPVSPSASPVPVSPSQAPVPLSTNCDTYIPRTRNRFINFPQHVYTSEDFERIELMKRMRGKTR